MYQKLQKNYEKARESESKCGSIPFSYELEAGRLVYRSVWDLVC